MPLYHYECPDGHKIDLWATIEEMEDFESGKMECECGRMLVRDLRSRRHISFHEGFYENISKKGEWIDSMDKLKRVAEENGQYSEYAEDMGGLFCRGNGRGRWI